MITRLKKIQPTYSEYILKVLHQGFDQFNLKGGRSVKLSIITT